MCQDQNKWNNNINIDVTISRLVNEPIRKSAQSYKISNRMIDLTNQPCLQVER